MQEPERFFQLVHGCLGTGCRSAVPGNSTELKNLSTLGRNVAAFTLSSSLIVSAGIALPKKYIIAVTVHEVTPHRDSRLTHGPEFEVVAKQLPGRQL